LVVERAPEKVNSAANEAAKETAVGSNGLKSVVVKKPARKEK